MVQRAESAGFSAIVLTIDAQLFGRRLADVRNGFNMPPHLRWERTTGTQNLRKRARTWFYSCAEILETGSRCLNTARKFVTGGKLTEELCVWY